MSRHTPPGDDVVQRTKYAIEWGNSDALHRDLLAEVEQLRAAIEQIRHTCADFTPDPGVVDAVLEIVAEVRS